MTAEKFPLTWPAGLPVTESREESRFKCTLAEARDGVFAELDRLGVDEFILSTNAQRNKKGQLTDGRLIYPNPGVAVYFMFEGQEKVIACDKWKYLHENLRAVEKSIKAIRGLGHWGCSDIIAQALPNNKQLAQNAGVVKVPWWTVLAVPQDATIKEIKEAYRLRAKHYHPDNQFSGNREVFEAIQQAYEEALKNR